MIRVLDARFLATAVEPKGYPSVDPPEVAFVGRSNVGKSSMLNALMERKKLVRVSNTPGRTRTLNFFDVDLEMNRQRRTVRLVDLPGYGFAKAPKAERESWDEMVTGYLQNRRTLKALVMIVDAEVGATPADVATLAYLRQAKGELLITATKLDRLPKAKRKPALARVAQSLDVPGEAVLPFSAVEKLGKEDVWAALMQALVGK